MAPREDLNLPEGEQEESKETDVTAEAVGVSTTDDSHTIPETVEADFKTEDTELKAKNETKNIAAEISALLDAPVDEKKGDVVEEEVSLPSVTLREKKASDDEMPVRRSSCFLTEIEEHADDEVFNPADITKNIKDMQEFLKEDKSVATEEGLDETVENIGVIEDEEQSEDIKKSNDLVDKDTESSDKEYKPASIVDAILAAAKANEEMEVAEGKIVTNEEIPCQSNLDNFNDERFSNEDSNEPAVVESEGTLKEPEQIPGDSIPAEIVEAATTIVDNVLEKAKVVMMERANAANDIETDTQATKEESTESNSITIESDIKPAEIVEEKITSDDMQDINVKDSIAEQVESNITLSANCVEEHSEQHNPKLVEDQVSIAVADKENIEIEDSKALISEVHIADNVASTDCNNPIKHESDDKIEDVISTSVKNEETFEDTNIDNKVSDSVISEQEIQIEDQEIETPLFAEVPEEAPKQVEDFNVEVKNQTVEPSAQLLDAIESLPLGELAVITLAIFIALLFYNY